MLTPDPEQGFSPLLALDIGSCDMRALYCHAAKSEPFAFLLPAPDITIAESILTAAKTRTDLWLEGAWLGPRSFEALRVHRAAAARAVLHPDLAANLTLNQAGLDCLGLPTGPEAPAGSERITCLDYDPHFWAKLCAASGLPRPERAFVSTFGQGRPLDPQGHSGRGEFLARLFGESKAPGLALEDLAHTAAKSGLLRLSAIEGMTGLPAIDATCACFLGLMALPRLAMRSRRQGLTLLHAHSHGIEAALVFQGHIPAFLHLPFGPRFPGPPDDKWTVDLPGLLKDFRLGWLPPEKAEELGGVVRRITELPAEAEGFAPLFAAGSLAEALEGKACIPDSGKTGPFTNCRGLLHGYANLEHFHFEKLA